MVWVVAGDMVYRAVTKVDEFNGNQSIYDKVTSHLSEGDVCHSDEA